MNMPAFPGSGGGLMDGMMQEALDAAFGAVMRDAIAPLVAEVREQRTEILALKAKQTELLQLIEQAKKGNWMVAKLFGGG